MVQAGRQVRAEIVADCHLGFPQLMAPVVHHGKFFGAIFTGGFLMETADHSVLNTIASRSFDIGLPVNVTEANVESIPILSEQDLVYLKDLMEEIVEELLARIEERRDRRVFGDIIGNSPPMRQLYAMLEKVAASDTTVLVTGENGTGKEIVARALHSMGARENKAFVATNCSALNDNLLESELFGHVRGAFTGAVRDKEGLFSAAHTGTLFLDEVGDTSAAMQVKLLRVLQEGTFMPVGATEPKQVDVRIIAATNRPLLQMVKDGTFREDLYYRLSVINLELPPLRDRKGDLPSLCEHFLEQIRRKTGAERKVLSSKVMERFWEYDWPGNVRQLENEIERAWVLSGMEAEVDINCLSPAVISGSQSEFGDIQTAGPLKTAVQSIERQVIRAGLIRTGWNKSMVARELGMSRTTLIKKIRELGLEESQPFSRS